MSWNYRVVRKNYGKRDAEGNLEDVRDYSLDYYEIHEVWYDENGKMCLISENPISVGGENMFDFINDLNAQITALKHPIVDYDDIPEEGSKSLVSDRTKELKELGEDCVGMTLNEWALSECDKELSDKLKKEDKIKREKSEAFFNDTFVDKDPKYIFKKLLEETYE